MSLDGHNKKLDEKTLKEKRKELVKDLEEGLREALDGSAFKIPYSERGAIELYQVITGYLNRSCIYETKVSVEYDKKNAMIHTSIEVVSLFVPQ